MRNLFLFMMVSVDGYFEGLNHDLSWHNVDDEFHSFAEEQDSAVDTLLFGHRTYELMADYWQKAHAFTAAPATAQFMNETAKIVVAHCALTPTWRNTTALSANVAEEIKQLKAKPGKEIAIFGSNNLCVSLMEAGLVDEFRIMVDPIALGSGTPLFAGLANRVKLKPMRRRESRSGNVLNVYARAE